MSKRLSKMHIKLLKSPFELACIFGAWICATDLLWLLHDIAVNGISITYCIILIGLITGLVGTVICLIHHHQEAFTAYRKKLLRDSLKARRHHRNNHPKSE